MGWFGLNLVKDISIDLGTANTLIYLKNKGIVLNEPSVVAIEETGGRSTAFVGAKAKTMLGKTASNVHVIRPLKDGVIADLQMTEIMLGNFINMVLKHRFFFSPRVIICIPSGVTEVERKAVKEPVRRGRVGAKEIYLVTEPIAAAIGLGLPIEEPTGNMVVDIGGGTTEIAVISQYSIVCDNSIRVGGDEMDEAIINYLKSEHKFIIGESTAEKIKMEIGSAYPLEEELTLTVSGKDLVTSNPKTIDITSQEIRKALSAPVKNIVDAVNGALQQTPPELASDLVENGIVMTGGGSLLKGLDKLLTEETNLPVTVGDDPLTCVVRGAGKILDNIKKYEKVLLKD